jgi:hypothetical protein
MSTRFAIGVVALVCGSVCGIVSSLVNFEIVDKVNERLPPERQFEALGFWYWSKRQRLKKEYERLYPDGTLLRRNRILAVLMFFCGLICVFAFGILRSQ